MRKVSPLFYGPADSMLMESINTPAPAIPELAQSAWRNVYGKRIGTATAGFVAVTLSGLLEFHDFLYAAAAIGALASYNIARAFMTQQNIMGGKVDNVLTRTYRRLEKKHVPAPKAPAPDALWPY